MLDLIFAFFRLNAGWIGLLSIACAVTALIIASIAEERSALVVLNQGNVVYAANSTDVTAEVINRLNAQLSTVDVTRVRLPEQQAAQAQQQ